MAIDFDDIYSAIQELDSLAEKIYEMGDYRHRDTYNFRKCLVARARKAYEEAKKQPVPVEIKYEDAREPLTECECNAPNARPPCGFCSQEIPT